VIVGLTATGTLRAMAEDDDTTADTGNADTGDIGDTGNADTANTAGDATGDDTAIGDHDVATAAGTPDRHERVMRAALLFQLDQADADALDDLLAIYDETTAHDDDQLRAAARLLARPDVADAFFNDAVGLDADRARAAEPVARAMRAATDEPTTSKRNASARAAAAWFLAQCLHTQGRTAEVEPVLDDALAADAGYRPALELAAHYASDRGDARKAMSLARRAGVPDNDSWVQMLSSMLPRQRTDLGRNDPCFCGSGRKYKQCHLNDPSTSLHQRAGWLYEKGIDHVQDSHWQHRLVEVGDSLLGLETTTFDSMNFAMTDAVVADLVFMYDGAWDDFVSTRGVLLPDDERVLAEQWATTARDVYEVTAITPGESVTVRKANTKADTDIDADTTTTTQRAITTTTTTEPGDIVVHEVAYSRTARIGDVVFARIAPVGDTMQFFGGLVPVFGPVHRHELAELLAARPDGVAVATLLHGWEATPRRVTNAEGEDVAFTTTTFRVDDVQTVMVALDGRDELVRADVIEGSTEEADRANDDDHGHDNRLDLPSAFGDLPDSDDPTVVARWSEHVSIKGADWIRGTFTLHDDRLVLRANSDERNARLRALLDEVIPGAAVIDETRQTVDPDDLSLP